MLREQLPVTGTLKRLKGLQNSEFVSNYLSDPERAEVILDIALTGWNRLISRFNQLHLGDGELGLAHMGKSYVLRRNLEHVVLPKLTSFSTDTYLSGLAEARAAFLNGQNVRRGHPPARGDIIKTSSMNTNAPALVVGVVGHLYERTVFAYLRSRFKDSIQLDDGLVRPLKTDDVLHPLVECAQLLSIEATLGKGDDSRLLPFFMSQNSHEPSGGLEWKRKDDVRAFEIEYAKWRLASLLGIEEPYNAESLDMVLGGIIGSHDLPSMQSAIREYLYVRGLACDMFEIGILAQMAYGH